MLLVLPGVLGDAGEVLTAQRAAFLDEARRYREVDLPPLRETLAEVRDAVAAGLVLVARDIGEPAVPRIPGRLVGAVRLERHRGVGWLGRLVVVPDRRGEGIAGRLLDAVVARARGIFDRVDLVTGAVSTDNVGLYARRGWAPLPGADSRLVDDVGIELVRMTRAVPDAALRTRELVMTDGADVRAAAAIWAAAQLARYRSVHASAGSASGAAGTVLDLGPAPDRPGALGVLIIQAGRPVGAALAQPARTLDGAGPDLVPGLAHLSAVCTDPVCWGRGVGRAAVLGALDAARVRGYRRVQLAVDVDNPRARDLYARLGFVRDDWRGTGRGGAPMDRWSRPLAGG